MSDLEERVGIARQLAATTGWSFAHAFRALTDATNDKAAAWDAGFSAPKTAMNPYRENQTALSVGSEQ